MWQTTKADRLKTDPQWFQKLTAGDAEATAEYERPNQDLGGMSTKRR